VRREPEPETTRSLMIWRTMGIQMKMRYDGPCSNLATSSSAFLMILSRAAKHSASFCRHVNPTSRAGVTGVALCSGLGTARLIHASRGIASEDAGLGQVVEERSLAAGLLNVSVGESSALLATSAGSLAFVLWLRSASDELSGWSSLPCRRRRPSSASLSCLCSGSSASAIS
jgi:hypothetical protein